MGKLVKLYGWKEDLKYYLWWKPIMKLKTIKHFITGEHKQCDLSIWECLDISEMEADRKAGRRLRWEP